MAELLSYPDQPGSLEPESRVNYRKAIAQSYSGTLRALRRTAELEHLAYSETFIHQRIAQGISADILGFMLDLPHSIHRKLVSSAILYTKDFQPGDNMTDKSLLYSQIVLQDGDIVPLDSADEKKEALQREMAHLIAEKDVLPADMREGIVETPHLLPYAMRIVKHCKQNVLLGTPPITQTTIWNFSLFNPRGIDNLPDRAYDRDEVYLETIPPVNPKDVKPSEKVLIISIHTEASLLSQVNLGLPDPTVQVEYCSRAASLWEKFFGTKDFVGDKAERSIPKKIIATGLIRGYNYHGGYTEQITDLLQNVSEKYNVELVLIRPTAP